MENTENAYIFYYIQRSAHLILKGSSGDVIFQTDTDAKISCKNVSSGYAPFTFSKIPPNVCDSSNNL